MRLIHISVGGPDINLFAGGRVWRFEDLNMYGTKTADTKGVAVILRKLKETL